jgi:hypothetical protein
LRKLSVIWWIFWGIFFGQGDARCWEFPSGETLLSFTHPSQFLVSFLCIVYFSLYPVYCILVPSNLGILASLYPFTLCERIVMMYPFQLFCVSVLTLELQTFTFCLFAYFCFHVKFSIPSTSSFLLVVFSIHTSSVILVLRFRCAVPVMSALTFFLFLLYNAFFWWQNHNISLFFFFAFRLSKFWR